MGTIETTIDSADAATAPQEAGKGRRFDFLCWQLQPEGDDDPDWFNEHGARCQRFTATGYDDAREQAERWFKEYGVDDAPVGRISFAPSVVAWHLVDRAYGGPEEGGWHFDYGRPIDAADTFHLVANIGIPMRFVTPRVFATQKAAFEFRRLLADFEQRANAGRRPIYSVLSEGEYRPMVQTGMKPVEWPADRPRYE